VEEIQTAVHDLDGFLYGKASRNAAENFPVLVMNWISAPAIKNYAVFHSLYVSFGVVS
jgi:hypothetical protein